MIRKFKHYATDEIRGFEVSSGHARIDDRWGKLVEFHKDIRVEETSWVLER